MKAKFHFCMAQLLYMEIRAGGGSLAIKDLTCKMPEKLRDSILENAGAFLAGSLGPDFYPDMMVGKLRVHPKKDINPGLWLTMMIEDFRLSYDPSKPENKEAREVFAFIAGWMTHYACDTFMNTYVNHVTSGYYGDDAKTPPDSKEAKRFFSAVETYLEIKLQKNPFLLYPNIKAPSAFLKRFFLEDRRVCFNNASSRSEFIFKKAKDEKKEPYLPGLSSSKEVKETKTGSDPKTGQPAAAEETPEEIAMLDYSEDYLDIFFLLGGIRKVFYFDEKAPFYEQAEIGKKKQARSERLKRLNDADELINEWLGIFEKLAGDMLIADAGDEGTIKERLAEFKQDLDEFEKGLKNILHQCAYVFIEDGLPQWLLDYLLRKNSINLGELAGQLKTADGSPFTGEIGIKIKGPYSPIVKQTNNLILNLCSDAIPKMTAKILKHAETCLQGGDPELILNNKWDKEKFDELLGDSNWDRHYSNNQTFAPYADALLFAKLCLIGASFDQVVKQVYDKSHKFIKQLYGKKPEDFFNLIEPKSYPSSTQRLRINIEKGESASLKEISVMFGANELLEVKNEKAYGKIYLQFEKYTKVADILSVSFTMLQGSDKKAEEAAPEDKPETETEKVPDAETEKKPDDEKEKEPDAETEKKPDDKNKKSAYKILVEAEDLKFKGFWKPLIIVEGALTSAEECKVEYTKNLPDNVDQSKPKAEFKDGEYRVKIPIAYKKAEKKLKKEFTRDDFDIHLGVFNFLKSLESGREWEKLEKDHTAYFYFLKTIMRLSDECYR